MMLQIVGASILLLGTFVCFWAIGCFACRTFCQDSWRQYYRHFRCDVVFVGMVIFTFGMDESLKFNLLVIVKLVSIGVFYL